VDCSFCIVVRHVLALGALLLIAGASFARALADGKRLVSAVGSRVGDGTAGGRQLARCCDAFSPRLAQLLFGVSVSASRDPALDRMGAVFLAGEDAPGGAGCQTMRRLRLILREADAAGFLVSSTALPSAGFGRPAI